MSQNGQEPAMFEQPSPDEIDALIGARLNGTPLPAGAAQTPDGAFALALLDAVDEAPFDDTYAHELEDRLRVAWRPRPHPSRLRALAPRLSSRLPSRPRAIAAAILLIIALLGALLAVPQTRAAIAAILHIGSVTIIPTPPTSGANEPTPLPSILDLAGQTTLDNAQRHMPFHIRLPAHPADLGAPQYVYLQDLDGSAALLVWVDPQHPDQVRMALNELSSDAYAYKIAPQFVQETQVHGQRALWTTGPYLLQVGSVSDQRNALRRLVTASHTLIWTEGNITYRLESDVSLEEAVRIAESLR
jgi:hypothetical protein